MKYRARTYYNDAQKAMMWERWKQGWRLHQSFGRRDRTSADWPGPALDQRRLNVR
jgi:hypothetical protein